ncbi:uncharacterized protein PHACADRAFT_63432, partial [Phanerochaete carnosa HHB-10118-sp]
QALEELSKISDKDDSQLQVAGVPVNRMQFNVIVNDIAKSLKQVQGRTGVEYKISVLESEVKLTSEDPAPSDGNYTDMYVGWYLATQKVAVRRFRDKTNADKAIKV